MDTVNRDRIKQLKELKQRHNLTYPKIMDILSMHNCGTCESTLKKLFSENSEEKGYQTETISQVYEALVDEFSDDPVFNDVETLKETNIQIDRLMRRLEDTYADRKESYIQTIEVLREQVAHLQEQIAHLQEQITDRDKSIARKDEILEKLLDIYMLKGNGKE